MSSSLIEETYFQAWGKAGGPGRVRRAFSLSGSMWRMLEFQIRKDRSGITDAEAAWLTAKRMYFSNPATQRLLDTMEGRAVDCQADFQETTARIVTILEEFGLRFHITGVVVAAYYGDPRSTQDVDIVIDLALNRPETKMLLDRMSSGYLVNKDAATDAIARRSLFQAIDQQSMIKIDFHVGGRIPGELGRSKQREIAPGLVAPIVSKEDAIVSKLLWIQQGSHRGRHDVKEMLRRDEDLDQALLKQLAASLNVLDLLDELDAEMRAGWSPS
jgi:hypothetical protein